MQAQVDFYDEVTTVPLPSNFSVFKNLISHYYGLPEEDVNELLFFDINGSKNLLALEEDYKKLLKRPKGLPIKILIEVSEKSKLFRTEERKVIDLDESINLDRDKDIVFGEVKDYGGRVKDILINQGEKAREMIRNQEEKAIELWSNHKEKVLDLWKRINLKDKVESAKVRWEEVFHKIHDKIPYFKQEEKKQEEKKEEEKKENFVHQRHQCDGCDKYPIVGNRYKCTICNDFDYCQDCETKFGETHDHPFLKIRNPHYAPIEIKCHLYHPF